MPIFAKILENDKGDQLLLCIKNVADKNTNEENEAELFNGVNFTVEQEGMFIDVLISPMSYESAFALLNNFAQSEAELLLKNPIDYFKNFLQ